MSRRPLLGLIIVAVLLVSGILLLTGPEDEGLPLDASDQADGPSEPSTDYPVYGDGEVLVSFEVVVPNGTPPEDMVFLQFDGYYHTSGWGVPMEEVEPGVWAVSFLAPADTPLTYKYNRNNGEYPTDEEFTTDSRETRRRLTVASSPLQVSDTVDKWRWLEHTQPQAVYSDYVPDDLPERDESFIVGIHLLDFYSGPFEDYVGSTLDRIADQGFEYVGFAYAPFFFTSSIPLEFTREPVNTYTKEQLENAFSMARERGLKIMLSAGLETDPHNFDVIEEGLRQRHSDEWYMALIEEWREMMVETAVLAETHKVEILALSNQWFFFGDQTPEQSVLVNGLVKGALREVNDVYTGKLTMDFYMPSHHYDYYSEVDWLADKWWWSLTDSKNATVAEMKDRAEEIVDEYYTPFHQEYGKPILLQQLAYASYDGAAGANMISTEAPEVSEYYPYNYSWPADYQEQVDAYEAVFQASSDEEMFTGVYAFSYSYWDSHDKSTGFRGKPAEDVWVRWNEFLTD